MGKKKQRYTPRRYAIFMKMGSRRAVVWDRMLSDALNAVGKDLSSSQAYAEVFRAGVRAILTENGDSDQETRTDLEVQEALAEVGRQEERKRQMAKLYEKLGLDRFVEWAEDHAVDWEAFLEDYRLFRRQEAGSWSEEAWIWLRDYLGHSDPVDTGVVKEAAIEGGIINTATPEAKARDWAKLRQVASRHDLSAEYGKWQYRPKLIPFAGDEADVDADL